MNHRPTKAIQVAREVRAVELRAGGWLHEAIGAELGVSRRAVGLMLERVKARELGVSAGQLEAREMARLANVCEQIKARVRAYELRMNPPRREATPDG
jgi:hypothetical protein